MFKLFKNLKPMAKLFVVVVILLISQAMAELFLPGMMSDIINDGIYLDYESMYEHETMLNPFGELEISGSVEGFDKDTIPVFEMQDGFSTVDLKTVWNQQFTSFSIDFEFMDIPVRDSRELFNDVLLPFMNSLMEFQFYKMEKKYGRAVNDYITDYTEEDKELVKIAFSKLIDYTSLYRATQNGKAININNFLEMKKNDDETSDEGVWDNDDARRLLTSCVMSMKHSENGNVLPIPVMTDAQGNTVRVEVDANGEAIDKSQLTYVYDEETGRPQAFPDYEIILCNKVLGYAYRYEGGQKWIKNKLGMSEYEIENNVGENTAAETNGFKKLLSILSLSKRGSTSAALSQKADKTREEWLTPDGVTIQTADMTFIWKTGGMMLLLTIFASACTILAMFLSSRIAAFFSQKLRSMVFKKVENFSLVEFDKFSTASLVTRSTNDINQIQNVFLLVLRTTLSAPVTILGGFIFSFRENVSMTMVLVYCIPIVFIAAGVAAVVVQPLFKLIQVKVDQLTLIMRESITGIRVVRAFNQQGKERSRFGEMNESVTKTAIKVQKYCALLVPLINIVLNCAAVGIYWRAALQVKDGTVTDVGSMLAVTQYVTQIAYAMIFIASAVVIWPRATASAARIQQVLNTESAIQDIEGAEIKGDGSGTIEFIDVSFKYSEEAEKNILEGISFKCEKGKTTAIVGGTGSGKSTVISMIPRFYDITGGSVLIDGQEVSTYPQAELRDKIGFVPQRSILFSGTIADNLRYGKEDATEEEMWEALRIAQSDTFVREKEGQLQYGVEQGGQNFSGGQKQRLSIARAVVRKPDIYIFDDSFSALDFKTDAKLRAALKAVTRESVVIIVAQRVGTIMDADNIIVLDDGRIIGMGKHEELIRNCQIYQDIALSQMSKEELGL